MDLVASGVELCSMRLVIRVTLYRIYIWIACFQSLKSGQQTIVLNPVGSQGEATDAKSNAGRSIILANCRNRWTAVFVISNAAAASTSASARSACRIISLYRPVKYMQQSTINGGTINGVIHERGCSKFCLRFPPPVSTDIRTRSSEKSHCLSCWHGIRRVMVLVF